MSQLFRFSCITAPAGRVVVYGASLLVCGAGIVVALMQLLGQGSTETLTLPIGLPWLGAHFRLDALSAFFLVVVNLGGAAASLYALGYGKHEQSPQRVLPFYPLFLAAMNLVVVADDAFSFLFAWEFMSLSSWALVMAHDQLRENVRAGYVYLVMASFGTLALLLAFGLLAGPEGDYAFDAIRESHPSTALTALVLILVLIGTGSKAGLVPLHAWLPLAHPAAPSHVSGLLSGVMTKVAVYAFVRIVFDLLGHAGMVVEHAGAGARRHHLRHGRALRADAARSEAAARLSHGREYRHHLHRPWACARLPGLRARLGRGARASPRRCCMCFNHSLFKNLLFLGAGAVLGATGERNMEHLGGLIHRMPLTAFTFLVGCIAISALPPLNGFVSEWLTFQAILQSPQLPLLGIEVLDPRRRRAACAFGRACRRLLRQGVRHHLSRPAAQRGRQARARGRRLLARRPCSRSPRSVCWPASCPASSSMRSRRSPSDGRRMHAAAARRAVPLHRAHRREPQLL